MTHFKFKNSVLVKQKGPLRAALLDSETEVMFEGSDDLARALLILYSNTTAEGLSLEALRQALATESESFRQNSQQVESLNALLSHLNQLRLLEQSETENNRSIGI